MIATLECAARGRRDGRIAMTRSLVTGGAGFIGSHLVNALLMRGDHVTVLDDLSTGKRERLDAHRGHPAYEGIEGTVLDVDLVDRLVRDADVVYHLAAVVGVHNVLADPLGAIRTNVHGTENALAAAARHGCAVVFASTSEIYGRSRAVPFAEDGERTLGPTWVQRWSYSTSKALDEHLAFAYADRGLPVAVIRYFNAYGPGIDARGYGSVIARFAAQALAGQPMTVHGDGAQSRCFTYVEDTVAGTILAAGAARPRAGVVFNIGSREETTVRRLAELVREELGSRSEIVTVPYESYYGPGHEDTRQRVPDTRHAERELGFVAKTSLREGLPATLEWCRKNFAVGRAS